MSHAPSLATLRGARSAARLAACLLLPAALASCSPSAPPPPSDATPPTVVSRQPAPGDDDVAVGLPITVGFSEDLDPATVTDATVLLAGDGSVNIAKTLALSGDTLTVTPLSALDLPEHLTLSLTSGIADEAGNALEPESWSWTVPAWLRLGDDPVLAYAGSSAIYGSLLDLDSQGRPVVAGNREESPQALLSRWDGQEWTEIPPPNGGDGATFVHDLAVAGDDVVVVWSGWFGETPDHDFYVSRWDGQEWSLFGDGLTVGDVYPQQAALAVDESGHPVVAFSQKASPGIAAADLLVRRWTGSAWQALGDKLDVNDDAPIEVIDLVLDPDGDPIVSWGERFYASSFVKAWDPTLQTWQALGGSISTLDQAAVLLVRSTGELVAAIGTTDQTIRLYRYMAPSWVPLGTALRRSSESDAFGPSLAENDSGEVVVGWSEYSATDSTVEVATLREGAWQYVDDDLVALLPSDLEKVKLRLVDGDTPAVVYTRFTQDPPPASSFQVETIFRLLNR
jgi:hypothetical protein